MLYKPQVKQNETWIKKATHALTLESKLREIE